MLTWETLSCPINNNNPLLPNKCQCPLYSSRRSGVLEPSKFQQPSHLPVRITKFFHQVRKRSNYFSLVPVPKLILTRTRTISSELRDDLTLFWPTGCVFAVIYFSRNEHDAADSSSSSRQSLSFQSPISCNTRRVRLEVQRIFPPEFQQQANDSSLENPIRNFW